MLSSQAFCFTGSLYSQAFHNDHEFLALSNSFFRESTVACRVIIDLSISVSDNQGKDMSTGTCSIFTRGSEPINSYASLIQELYSFAFHNASELNQFASLASHFKVSF